MAEGWKKGLGPFAKVKEDAKWGKNFVRNAEEDCKPGSVNVQFVTDGGVAPFPRGYGKLSDSAET